MSEVIVVAEIGVLPDKRDEALAGLERLCEETHAKDPGCLLYALHLDPADESHVFMIEKWESPEALQAHGGSDHIKAFGQSGVLSGAPQVTVLTAAGYGDAGMGIL
jgi:quinol monooxygenase YgiN